MSSPEFDPSDFEDSPRVDPEPKIRTYAVTYRDYGLQVVPAFTPGDRAAGMSWKRPMLATWRQFSEVLIPDATFQLWYGPRGQYIDTPNIGFLTGSCSNNVFVLDLDTQKKPEAQAWWSGVLEAWNAGIEPETWKQTTGGGGRQLLFRAPPGWVVRTIKTSIGVDIRGQGGFAVLPPSMHESGSRYAWDISPDDTPIADAPQWLLDEIENLDPGAGATAAPGASKPSRPTDSPEGDYDAWGNAVDSREAIMRDVVWHAVLELYRRNPIQPAEGDWPHLANEAYETYERKVTTRHTGVPKTEGLELEGRGTRAFWQKWRAAMRQWGKPKFVQDAGRPNPNAGQDQPDMSADFEEAAQRASQGQGGLPPEIFEYLDVRQILAMADPLWLLRGIVPERSLGFMFGPPGSLKTFIALDIGLSIATGRSTWWNRVIERKGAVLYISSEGAAGLKFRLMAWAQHRRVTIEDAPFFLIKQTLNFMRPEDVGKLLATVEDITLKTSMPIAAVFVDTVSRVLAGAEENQQKDMTLFVQACDMVRERFGATVVGLHHTNANGGMRGSTVMPGAADFLLEVKREPGAKQGLIYAKKIKDAEDGWEQHFTVVEVSCGDVAGHTSLVLGPSDPPPGLPGWPPMPVCVAILAACGKAWDEGKPWSQMANAQRYAPRIIHVGWGVDAKIAKDMILNWLDNDLLEDVVYNTSTKQKGLHVIGSFNDDAPPHEQHSAEADL